MKRAQAYMMTKTRHNFSLWKSESIVSAFEKAATNTPDIVAIIDGDFEISYRQLNAQANQLASFLKKQFINFQKPIAVFIPKSHWYLLACITSLKTGRAYVHIDSEYSEETILQVLKDSEPELILTVSLMKDKTAKTSFKRIFIDEVVFSDENPGNSEISIDSEATAIIGYTSGTTGTPKGVAVSHRACLYAFCKFWQEVQDVNLKNRFGYLTYLAWDALSPLIFNATGIVMPDDVSPDFSKTLDCIQQHKINHIFFTPSLLNKLLTEASPGKVNDAFKWLNIVWLGGEIVQKDLILKMRNRFPQICLLNNYGPTEFFVVSQGNLDVDDAKKPLGVPAGRILPEVCYILLDENLNDVTAAGAGFLCVSGPAIANGYVNNEALTRQKFLPINDKIYYLTGDYSQVLPNGEVTILARQNRLVPNGNKNLFLKDIEDQFLNETYAKECAAILVPDRNGNVKVRIYYSTINNQEIVKSPFLSYISDWNVECVKVPLIPLHPTSAKVHYSKLSQMNEI